MDNITAGSSRDSSNMAQQIAQRRQEQAAALLKSFNETLYSGETRDQKIEQATTAPVQAPTKEEANSLQGFYNKTLGHIDTLRGQNYQMPQPVKTQAAESSSPVAGTAAAGDVSRMSPDEEKTINGYSKWVMNLESTRNDHVNKTGQLPPALPINLAESNLMGMVKYVTQSHETDALPEQRKAMEECLAAAKKDYTQAGDKALPFPVYLSSHMSQAGNDGKMNPAIASTGDEYIRSYHDKTPPMDPGTRFNEKLD